MNLIKLKNLHSKENHKQNEKTTFELKRKYLKIM